MGLDAHEHADAHDAGTSHGSDDDVAARAVLGTPLAAGAAGDDGAGAAGPRGAPVMGHMRLHRALPPPLDEPNVDREWFTEQLAKETTHIMTAERRQEIIAYHLADVKARLKWPASFRAYARAFQVVRVNTDDPQRTDMLLFRVRAGATVKQTETHDGKGRHQS